MSREQEKLGREILQFAKSQVVLIEDVHENRQEQMDKIAKLEKMWSEECCRRPSGEEMATQVENFVNVMSHQKEEGEFAEKMVHGTHRTLNQSFWGMIFRTMALQADECRRGRFDARNEASGKMCLKIVEHMGEELQYLPFI